MPTGVYERKKYPILCHPEAKRHVRGYCVNCYSKILKKENPVYKENQKAVAKKRYEKLGSKIVNKNAVSLQRLWRLKVVEKLGNKCNHCGFSDVRALQIDHINGDGYKERNIRKSLNRKIALGLIDTSRYQILCANCNWIKKVENNEQNKKE
jgi:DNA-directed RNA polymerase subunit RPC12/RpoP